MRYTDKYLQVDCSLWRTGFGSVCGPFRTTENGMNEAKNNWKKE